MTNICNKVTKTLTKMKIKTQNIKTKIGYIKLFKNKTLNII